jgi:hypothetical protein
MDRWDRHRPYGRGIEITPGHIEWEEPTERVHRAVNGREQTYKQVTVFLLDHPDGVPNLFLKTGRHNSSATKTETAPIARSRSQFPVHPTMPSHAAFGMAVRRQAFASLMTFS